MNHSRQFVLVGPAFPILISSGTHSARAAARPVVEPASHDSAQDVARADEISRRLAQIDAELRHQSLDKAKRRDLKKEKRSLIKERRALELKRNRLPSTDTGIKTN